MIDSFPSDKLIALLEKQAAAADKQMVAALHSQWEQFGEIRDKTVLTRLVMQSEPDYQRYLAAHPARGIHEDVANVNRAFDILSESRRTLVELAGTYHSQVEHDLVTDD
ncbi:hypothetical protein [Bradyrhizobium sp. AZCC 2289]|uniref:hypothetical protein n=1 Tax=Bradyrhizobium sp. AZCC 2289 TaxID=3117026 RepID=UPI002FF02D7D